MINVPLIDFIRQHLPLSDISFVCKSLTGKAYFHWRMLNLEQNIKILIFSFGMQGRLPRSSFCLSLRNMAIKRKRRLSQCEAELEFFQLQEAAPFSRVLSDLSPNA